VALLANTLIAGSAATGVFRLVQKRLLVNSQTASEHAPKAETPKAAAPVPSAKTKLAVVGAPAAATVSS